MEAIRTDDLTKYYGRTRGIESISLHVPEGAFYGFIGPNGAGKSTTIRALLGLLQPSRGQSWLLGRRVTQADASLRTELGYVPGEANLYPEMRVRDFLAFSARFYPGDHSRRATELVRALELDVDRRIGTLSLGNRKKVAIVQALQHQPRLLILDEPTSGLDPLIQQRFFSILLEENARGATIFFSSHVLSEVQRFCQTVAIIRDGQILATEDMAALRARQFKRVQLHVPAADTAALATLSSQTGVRDATTSSIADGAATVRFLYTGDIADLLATLQTLTLLDLLIEEPSLEEIFLQYYSREADPRANAD